MTKNFTNQLMAYEAGELDDHQVVELFQELLDCGLCWRLQGHYGRMAQRLLDSGEIVRREVAT